jgi:hypothetical protein
MQARVAVMWRARDIAATAVEDTVNHPIKENVWFNLRTTVNFVEIVRAFLVTNLRDPQQ